MGSFKTQTRFLVFHVPAAERIATVPRAFLVSTLLSASTLRTSTRTAESRPRTEEATGYGVCCAAFIQCAAQPLDFSTMLFSDFLDNFSMVKFHLIPISL